MQSKDLSLPLFADAHGDQHARGPNGSLPAHLNVHGVDDQERAFSLKADRPSLIEEPPRRSGGFREFSPAYIDRIRFIKRAQELGFTLSEVADLLALRIDPETTCREIKSEAEEKLENVEEKIRDLERIRTSLTRLIDQCRGTGPTSDCPILDAMKDGSGAKSS